MLVNGYWIVLALCFPDLNSVSNFCCICQFRWTVSYIFDDFIRKFSEFIYLLVVTSIFYC